MFSSEQDHCSGGKREHPGELHCSRNNQDQVCRGYSLSIINGFIIFELWTKMEDNLIFFPRPWQIMRILPTKRWKTFLLAGESYLTGAMVHWCRIIFESLQKKMRWPTTYSTFDSDWLHIAIHVSVQLLKIDIILQIWPAWRDGGNCELFGVGRGLILFSNWILILFRLNIKINIKGFPSYQASYLTGENIVLAGGMNARLWYSLKCCWKWC